MIHRIGLHGLFKASVAACLASLFIVSAPAQAQSQSELRRENQRLQAELNDLAREHAEAQKQIAQLIEEIRKLRELLASLGQTAAASAAPPPPRTEPEVSIDETIPNASPRALLAALKDSYESEMENFKIGASPGDPDREIYLRELQRWRSRSNREFRSSIEWHVKIVAPAVPAGRGYAIRVQAVDPETAVQLGDAFDAHISRAVASRLQQLERREELDDVLILKGVLVPRVHVNEDRDAEGSFNNPPLIGPFAEYFFTVDAQSIKPVPEKDEKQETDSENGGDG